MPLRYALAALIVVLTAPVLLSLVAGLTLFVLLLSGVGMAAAVFMGGAGVATAVVRLAGGVMRGFLNYLRVLWSFFKIRGRGLEFVPPAVVFPGLFVTLLIVGPEVPDERGAFLSDYSSFFQTAAQVLAALLIAMAVEVRAPKTVEDVVTVRPASVLMVFLLVLAELAAMAALSPFLPASLYSLELNLTISGGVAALLAVLLVSRRILVD